MRRRLGRIFGVLLIVVMLFSLTACSKSNDVSNGEDKEKKVIKLFHRFPDEPFNSFIEKIVAEYEADHPDIDIVVSSAQNQPYKEKIKVVVGSKDCPDVFFSWSGEFSERFLREGLIMDLTESFNNDQEWKNSLLESQVNEYRSGDILYGIPFRLDAKMMFYNIDIFKENNLEIPKTWDKFIEVCEALEAKDITPISYGNQDQWPSSHYIGSLNQMLVDNDTRLKDLEPATGEFTDPNYLKALEYYQQLIPYFNDSVNGLPHDMARNNFAQEKAAMFFAELVEITYLAEENPDLNYGMFSFPLIEGEGDPTLLTGSPEGFVVSANTKYPEESIEFLKYFTGPEVGKKEVQEVGWFNAGIGIVEGLEDQKLLEAYEVIKSAKTMSGWFDASLYSTIANEYLTSISDLTNGDITPEEVMEKIQKVAEEARNTSSTEVE
ncbi:putative ABC transporter extracellular-binding protein YurO [Vallitalea longa]|uniref:ABC transporter extracellular-binding protein YurO n=1 Tax=Vallitalea longa TaxID=2936439 RepID=A0A9W5YGJ3_9FIRM|nr:extracellular solute-binding protein [Vallitalea longa]GKX31524.1 putative ABC transporter extracellular-binding protein YurO [Vallitalea longa]